MFVICISTNPYQQHLIDNIWSEFISSGGIIQIDQLKTIILTLPGQRLINI
jgi:hypothetical protein